MVNTHLSSAVCLHAGLWKSMASHFWWIEPLVRALSHRKYLRFFSLYNPKRCRFQLCRRPTSAKGKWPAVKRGSQVRHCQLMSGVTHSGSVSRGVTKMLSPLAFGRCLDLPGLLCQVHQVEFLMWAGTVKEGLCGYRKERNPNRQSILKDEKESVGNKNWKVRLEKMKTRKWTEMLWKVDREEEENWSVWNVQYMRTYEKYAWEITNQRFGSCWRKKIWKFLSQLWLAGDLKLCLFWILQRAHTFSEYLPWVTFFPLCGLAAMEIRLKTDQNFRKCDCF